MSANRLMYALITVALALVAAFTFNNVSATTLLTRAGRQQSSSALSVAGHRGGVNPNLVFNQQPTTTSGAHEPTPDRSYAAIEILRAARGAK